MRRSPRLLSLVLALAAALLQPCLAAGDNRHVTLPKPVVVKPDQFWGGIDGLWSTFMIRVGDPPQFHRVLVSTASQQTWTVYEQACKPMGDVNLTLDQKCDADRGLTFNDTKSSSWVRRDYYRLWLEGSLGIGGNGLFGYDSVGLGGLGEEGPTIKNCTVGTMITPEFWLGHFGVNPKSTNFTAFTEPSLSFMTYAFEQKQIPSLSFGYTAGSRYRLGTFLGSLTLGGYDASRFIPNDVSFGFSPDNERDIVVGVTGITANSATKTDMNLLGARQQFTMYIDSTVAEIWLPTDVCDVFAKAFGLKYDNATELYLVDDLLHETLVAENTYVTFSLGQRAATNKTVDISLPYAAFDLTASAPYRGLNKSSRYFPIRRGKSETQFVFGRTFLQEAYLIVDWERQNFSVSQVNWQYGAPQKIEAIYSSQYADLLPKPSVPKKPLGTGPIIGIAIGGGFSLAMIVCGVIYYICRKRRQKKKVKLGGQSAAQAGGTDKDADSKKYQQAGDGPASPKAKESTPTNVIPKAELPADSVCVGKEDGLPSPTIEVENTERQVFEMPGDFPVRQEAGGRQLTEKESMVVRERIYNGVDPNDTPMVSPTTEEAPPRRPPLLASDVTMLNSSMPSIANVSPTTPRTPRDGALLEAGDTFFQPPPSRGGRLGVDDTLLCPISPLEGPTDRRRFSYES